MNNALRLIHTLILCLILSSNVSFASFQNHFNFDYKQSEDLETSRKIPSVLFAISTTANQYGIVVEKKSHTLFLFKTDNEGFFSLVKQYPAITGKNIGNKKIAGDRKTPEGIYFATSQLDGKLLPSKYGPGAFTLDYPNVYDTLLRKTGNGIWIHGVQNNKRILTPFDTEGCVALKNSDWLDLKQYISLEETPVIITEEVSYFDSMNEFDEAKTSIAQYINFWKTSWESSKFEDYADFYSPKFSAAGLDKNKWIKVKENLAKEREMNLKINISNLRSYSSGEQMIITFDQDYVSSEKKDFGRKVLYLQKEETSYKIISEKWREIEKKERI